MAEDVVINHYTISYVYPDSFREVTEAEWYNGYRCNRSDNTIVTTSTYFSPSAVYKVATHQDSINVSYDNFYGAAPYEGVYTGL